MSELKACPFCEADGKDFRYGHLHKEGCFYWLLDHAARTETVCPPQLLREAYNTRPIEDALTARVAELEGALKEVKELALELAVMNTTLATSGDIPEKSVKNFYAEIKRISDGILDRIAKEVLK